MKLNVSLCVAVAGALTVTSNTANAKSPISTFTNNNSTLTASLVADATNNQQTYHRVSFQNRDAGRAQCMARKEKAMSLRDDFQAAGLPKTDPSWVRVNRQIAFLSSECPGRSNTVVASVCKSRSSALEKKLSALKAAGFDADNPEVTTTVDELEALKLECTEASIGR